MGNTSTMIASAGSSFLANRFASLGHLAPTVKSPLRVGVAHSTTHGPGAAVRHGSTLHGAVGGAGFVGLAGWGGGGEKLGVSVEAGEGAVGVKVGSTADPPQAARAIINANKPTASEHLMRNTLDPYRRWGCIHGPVSREAAVLASPRTRSSAPMLRSPVRPSILARRAPFQ